MKKFTLIYILMLIIAGGVLLVNLNYNNKACAESKCHYRMVCQGNSSIQSNVCVHDCNDANTKRKVIEAFKKQCSHYGKLTSPQWGWGNCDITLN